MPESLLNVCCFCLNVRWKSDDVLGRDRFLSVSRAYPVWGPLICGAACAVTGAAGVLFFRLSGLRLLSAAWMLLLFYLIRGIRLIDAFCDLSEGLTYARGRNAENAWNVIRSPSNGAFAILWTGILLLIQFCAGVYLVVLPAEKAVGLTLASGALSAAGCVFCHVKGASYQPGSAFSPFLAFCRAGNQIKAFIAAGCCCLPLFFFGSGSFPVRLAAFLFLIAAACLTSRLSGLLILRTLKGFNGDVLGFVSLMQHAFVLCLGLILF